MGINIPDKSFIEALSKRTVPMHTEFVASGMKNSDLPPSITPEFALVGRSNVGKSSLLNYIAGQQNLARVSRTPGRTQTINHFDVLHGSFVLLDLPGYGFAKSPHETRAHWEKNLSSFFKERDGLFTVLHLIDARREIVEEDSMLSDYFHSLGLNVVGVHTKIDKVHKSQIKFLQEKLKQGLGTNVVVSTSAEKKIGLNDLFKEMANLLEYVRKESGK